MRYLCLRNELSPMSPVRRHGTLARPEGLEPPAYWFEASRSIHLSYGRTIGVGISQRSIWRVSLAPVARLRVGV